MTTDPETAALLGKILLGVLVTVLLGDLCILGMWAVGQVRKQPLLAPTWSAADVFVGLQLVVAIIATLGCFITVPAAFLVPADLRRDSAAASAATLALILVPLMLIQQGALVLVPAALVQLRYREPLSSLGILKPDTQFWRQVAGGAILALLLLPINDLIEVLARHWLLDSGWLPKADILRALSEEMSAVRVLDQVRDRPIVVAGLVVIIGLVGPIAEEVFFRGFAYTAFKRRFGISGGVVLSAFLFAIIHGNPVAMIPILFIGVVLAVLFDRTGSLAAPIGLHCANNTAVVALYFLARDFSFWGWLFR